MHIALRSRIRGYGYEVFMKDSMKDTPENRKKLGQFVAQEVKNDGRIPHFTKEAVAEVIKEAQRRAGKKDAKFAMDARTVALTGYKGMMQGKLIIIPSIKYKIEVFLAKLLPAKIIASYVGKWQQSLKN